MSLLCRSDKIATKRFWSGSVTLTKMKKEKFVILPKLNDCKGDLTR